MQEAADADITADPLAANAATEVSAGDDGSAGEDEEVTEEQEQEEDPSTVSEATTGSPIQPDQTVDTGSQHVLKVSSCSFAWSHPCHICTHQSVSHLSCQML